MPAEGRPELCVIHNTATVRKERVRGSGHHPVWLFEDLSWFSPVLKDECQDILQEAVNSFQTVLTIRPITVNLTSVIKSKQN